MTFANKVKTKKEKKRKELQNWFFYNQFQNFIPITFVALIN